MANKDYKTKSHMPSFFHDWLDQCPVEWQRIDHDEDGSTYWFKFDSSNV